MTGNFPAIFHQFFTVKIHNYEYTIKKRNLADGYQHHHLSAYCNSHYIGRVKLHEPSEEVAAGDKYKHRSDTALGVVAKQESSIRTTPRAVSLRIKTNMNDITVSRPADNSNLVRLLKAKMEVGVVTFAYKKVSTNEVRIARGTTNSSLFQYEYKNPQHEPTPGIITYWDMDKQGWRSLHEDNILQII